MHGLRVLLAGVLVLGTAIAAGTEIEAKQQLAPREPWQATFSQAQEELVAAQQRLDDAQVAYRNMRHRRRARGEKKQQIIDSLHTAEAELTQAKLALETATMAARQAGATPGWFRSNSDALRASQTKD